MDALHALSSDANGLYLTRLCPKTLLVFQFLYIYIYVCVCVSLVYHKKLKKK